MNGKLAERILREKLSVKGYAWKTEQSYTGWCRRYMLFLLKRSDLSSLKPTGKVEAFLTHLARDLNVAPSTQNQALNALLFLYKHVLREKVGEIRAMRARGKVHRRHAPSVAEARALLSEIRDVSGYPIRLVCQLLYGCGMRVNEPLNLRVRDVCLERKEVLLRNTKGGKDRFARIPDCLLPAMATQLRVARTKWEGDRASVLPVQLPHAYRRRAASYEFSWNWAWLFPLHSPSPCPRSGRMVRWHLLDKNIQREVKRAAKVVEVDGSFTPHCFRHAWATHLLNSGANVKDIQDAMGHKNIETTMVYLHSETDRLASPLDSLKIAI